LGGLRSVGTTSYVLTTTSSTTSNCRPCWSNGAPDSPLEGDGFELSVPRQRRAPLATDNQGEEVRFALDSLLEQSGFELSVPLALKLVVSRKRELDGGILIGDDDGMIP